MLVPGFLFFSACQVQPSFVRNVLILCCADQICASLWYSVTMQSCRCWMWVVSKERVNCLLKYLAKLSVAKKVKRRVPQEKATERHIRVNQQYLKLPTSRHLTVKKAQQPTPAKRNNLGLGNKAMTSCRQVVMIQKLLKEGGRLVIQTRRST